jgi:hypothetical protein
MSTVTHNTITNRMHQGTILWTSTYPLAQRQDEAGAFQLHHMALRGYRGAFRLFRQERAQGVPAAAPTPILMGFRWTR